MFVRNDQQYSKMLAAHLNSATRSHPLFSSADEYQITGPDYTNNKT